MGLHDALTPHPFRYRGQFVKVLHCLQGSLLPEMRDALQQDQPEAALKLELYITKRLYASEPEGRAMPRVDESSYYEDG